MNSKAKGAEQPPHKTIFNEILDSKLPPEEKKSKRLREEAQIIVGAVVPEGKFALAVEICSLLKEELIALRLSYGVPQRPPRITPNPPLQYKDYTIPAGYSVSMDPVHTHHNEDTFPDSYAFKPERWLQQDSLALRKYNIAFSRETRQCIGMHLANAELFLTLSMIFRRFDMELFEIDGSAVRMVAEYFLPKIEEGKELKVTVKKTRT